MSKQKSRANAQSLSRGAVIIMRVLLAAAMLLSIYLAYVSFGGGTVAGCGPESGCDKVLRSRWSRWFGIPVSVPAVVVYGLMLAGTLRLTPGATPAQQRQAWLILLPTAWAIIAAVVWFATLQIGVIKAICPFCMASHACGLMAALILLFRAPIREAPEKPWQQEKEVYLPPKKARQLTAVALAAAALLIAGQIAYRPASFNVTAVGDARLQQTETNRTFEIYDGRFVFDMNEVPLIGTPRAPHAMVSLFDYTCHFCRAMHVTLKEVHKTFSNQLAIVSLPMPLDSQCNPNVRMTSRFHSNACEYARLGLAVWRADRKVHPQFDDWLFAPEHPPELEVARQHAAQLVGPEKLAAALSHHTITQHLQLGMNIYATNFIHVRQGNMPQVIIGTNLLTGTNTVEELYRLLDNQLGLKATNLVSQAK
jgi:uncharacterized membrane protein/protein-disulfide isomerase